MSRSLAQVFADAKAEGRAALIGYLPAGFPTAEQSVDMIAAMVDGGVDIVEVGLPYSDPLMDGPDIQSAVELALVYSELKGHAKPGKQLAGSISSPPMTSKWIGGAPRKTSG